jgi:hypothetical protein
MGEQTAKVCNQGPIFFSDAVQFARQSDCLATYLIVARILSTMMPNPLREPGTALPVEV